MTILNAPIRDSCIARRERTNTPSQALLLLNEGEYLKAARHLARRVLAEEGLAPAERVDLAYESVTARLPDEMERSVLLELVTDLQRRYGEDAALASEISGGLEMAPDEEKAQLGAWTVLVSALYNLDITKSRD